MSDDRNWSKYNDELVRRGQLELDEKIMDEWREELRKKETKRRKGGRTISLPRSVHPADSIH
jgi:hypothetical protein